MNRKNSDSANPVSRSGGSKDSRSQGPSNAEILGLPDSLGPDDVVVVTMDGSPEQIAQSLIQDSLPKTFLDEIDISSDEGFAMLFTCLMLRVNQATIEKDEIMRFTERNRAALEGGYLELLQAMGEKGASIEGGEDFAVIISHFSAQVRKALDGHPEDIDIMSDRTLWLLYALGLKLSKGGISYKEALQILNKPEHRQRISRRAVYYMIKDFMDTYGQSNQPDPEYVMMISECALILEDVPGVKGSLTLLRVIPPPADKAAWLDLFERGHAFLAAQGSPDPEITGFLEKSRARFGERLSDDDL